MIGRHRWNPRYSGLVGRERKMSVSTIGKLRRAPIGLVLMAPLVAGLYYLVLKAAFIRSIDAAVGQRYH
jgi:hypothetical protein